MPNKNEKIDVQHGGAAKGSSRDEKAPAERISAERQKLIDNPNLNQAGNERGSHDEPETGSQTGADID